MLAKQRSRGRMLWQKDNKCKDRRQEAETSSRNSGSFVTCSRASCFLSSRALSVVDSLAPATVNIWLALISPIIGSREAWLCSASLVTSTKWALLSVEWWLKERGMAEVSIQSRLQQSWDVLLRFIFKGESAARSTVNQQLPAMGVFRICLNFQAEATLSSCSSSQWLSKACHSSLAGTPYRWFLTQSLFLGQTRLSQSCTKVWGSSYRAVLPPCFLFHRCQTNTASKAFPACSCSLSPLPPSCVCNSTLVFAS